VSKTKKENIDINILLNTSISTSGIDNDDFNRSRLYWFLMDYFWPFRKVKQQISNHRYYRECKWRCIELYKLISTHPSLYLTEPEKQLFKLIYYMLFEKYEKHNLWITWSETNELSLIHNSLIELYMSMEQKNKLFWWYI